MSITKVAFADPNPLSQAVTNRQIESELTQSDRVMSGIFPLIEAQVGCEGAKSVRDYAIFGVMPLFKNKWECLGVENPFNSGASLPLTAGNNQTYKFIYSFAGFIFAILILVIALKVASGHDESSESRKAMAFSFVIFVSIIAVACLPYYKNDKGENSYSLAVITYLAFTAFAMEGASQQLSSDAQLQQIEYPFISIPEGKNQKTNEIAELIRFNMCNSKNYQSTSKREGSFKLTRDGERYNMFSQRGNCVFNMDMKLNTRTVQLEKDSGLPSNYTAFADRRVSEIMTKTVADTQALVNHAISTTGRIANSDAIPFEPANFSCVNRLTYPVNSLSEDGLSNYLYAGAECIQDDLVKGFSKYPNISDDFYGNVVSGRMVHLCEQDTYVSSAKGSVTDQQMDSTPAMKKAGDTLTTINQKASACVVKMCSEDSSPYVCSAAINYYAMMTGNNHLTSPSIITLPAYFVSLNYSSNKIAEDGKLLLNSLSMESSTATSILDSSDDLNVDVLATIPYTVGIAGAVLPDDVLRTSTIAMATATDILRSLKDWAQIGTYGYFGENYTKECMMYPNQISPSKYNCGNYLNTIHNQGQWWLAAGIEIKVMARLANVGRKSKAAKAEEVAVIGAIKSGLQSVSVAGTASTIAKIVAAGALDNSVADAYSEYGNHLTPTAIIALSVAMAVPEFVSFLNTIGNILQGIGMFTAYAPQIIVLMTHLGIMLSIIVGFVYFTYTFMLYFVIILSKNNGVNPTTDWFKPFDEFVRMFYAILSYPAIFIICLAFLSCVFMFNLLDVSSMIQMHDTVDTDMGTFANIPVVLARQAIQIFLPIFFIGAVLKVCRNTPTIVNSHIYGNIKDVDERDDNYAIELKKLNL